MYQSEYMQSCYWRTVRASSIVGTSELLTAQREYQMLSPTSNRGLGGTGRYRSVYLVPTIELITLQIVYENLPGVSLVEIGYALGHPDYRLVELTGYRYMHEKFAEDYSTADQALATGIR
jgi:hypothetical protein